MQNKCITPGVFRVPESCRITDGPLASSRKDGNNGVFVLPYIHGGRFWALWCIASDGLLWEHVSVSVSKAGRGLKRCPTWDEMCHVKDAFWYPEAAVIQIHPPRTDYRNLHPWCLHLWRPTAEALPLPPAIMVAPPSNGDPK